MNTSMLIAQECLKNETEEDTTYQGLETFAATIDSSKNIFLFIEATVLKNSVSGELNFENK
jgi:hypothetical protein